MKRPARHAVVAATVGLVSLVTRIPTSATAGTTRMSMDQEEIQEVILRVKPSAVLIGVKIQGQAAVSCDGGPAKPISVQPRMSTGTGFVIHPNGYIATNAHVVGPVREPLFEEGLIDLVREVVTSVCVDRLESLGPAERAARVEEIARRPENRLGLQVERAITVSLQDGITSAGTVLASRPPISPQPRPGVVSGATPPGDVAILKVDRRDLVAAPLGRAPVQIGDETFVVGFPGVVLSHELLSPRSRESPSVTLGRVSGFKFDAEEHEVIQTDAAITWGNSGGPAFNARGEVIGVATFISAGEGEGPNVQGFNFLVPTGRVLGLAADIGLSLSADSPSARRWQDAVRAFFTGRYDAAIGGLEAILQRDPDFPDAKRLLAAARARPERDSPEWKRWMGEMRGEWSDQRTTGGQAARSPAGKPAAK